MGHLQGIGIVFGNITNSNTIELTEVASSLGATVLQPADAQRASYLVASNVLRLSDGSDPYLTAIRINPELLAVSTEWLAKCHEERRRVDPARYPLGPFSGIRVSITNFGAKERDPVVSQLKQGGAAHSPELFRSTTHLVGNRPGGSKYIHAKDWGILIVHYNWVVDCLKAGRRLDESLYSLDAPGPPAPALTSGTDVQQRQASKMTSRGGVATHPASSDVGAAGTAAHVGPSTTGAALRPSNGNQSTDAAHRRVGATSEATARQVSGNQQAASAPIPAAQAAGQGAGGRHNEQFFYIPDMPPDDCYFLHWVRMWVVGCTGSEQSHVLAAVRESGATREPVLTAAVTHIVFGSVLSTADLAEVRMHLSEHREQVKLARLSWLYECVNRRAYMEPEGPYAITPAQLQLAQAGVATGSVLLPQQAGRSAGQRGREDSPVLVAPAVTSAPSAAPSGHMVNSLDDYIPLDPEGTTRTMDGTSSRGPGVFTGLWFTLVAVEGTEEHAEASRLVRLGGGLIMSASTEKTVRELQRRYAVCPFSMPQAVLDRICNTRGRERGQSEFERVPVEQRVTLAWLRACVNRSELLAVKRETPLFRPLPHELPLPRFHDVMVAVSQYHEEQRDVLKELITRLGGTFTDRLNKRCNYLVIHEARGDKFMHAMKWGIPCVRADWVLESAYAGRPLDDQLLGFLPSGITPAEMEERRMAASRAGGAGCLASQLGPTQLGPTQRPGPQLPAPAPLRGQQAADQGNTDTRASALPPGLPPRPSQATDKRGMPAAAAIRPMGPPTSVPNRGTQLPMAPPPAPAGVAKEPAQEQQVQPAPIAPSKPTFGLQSLMATVLGDDADEADPYGASVPPGRQDEQVSANGVTRVHAGGMLGLPPYSSGSAQAPAAASSAQDQASNGGPLTLTSAATGGKAPDAAAPTSEAPQHAPELEHWQPPKAEVVAVAAREHDDAAAMLLEFMDSHNHRSVPELMCSQIDMPMMVGLAAERSMGGAAASSLSSREPAGSTHSLKTTDGDGDGVVGGRRSRKRNAAAAVGEKAIMSRRVGALPGRRGRSDDDEEGFGVAMSQRVSYEAATVVLPPRTTRSATRSGRGSLATSAKENLIKAVQGNI